MTQKPNIFSIEFSTEEEFFEDEDFLRRAAETAFPTPTKETHLSEDEKIDLLEKKFSEILEILGLDLKNNSLKKTPHRIAKMYVKELFSGLDLKKFPKVSFVEDPCIDKDPQMILVKNVSLKSFCEHHFVPMIGTAKIAYIPKNGKIIGLSKINRIADHFCKRPQLQERLTAQIADSLSIVLDTEDIAVYTHLKHYCVTFRGIQDHESITETQVLRGKFREKPFRGDFLSKI